MPPAHRASRSLRTTGTPAASLASSATPPTVPLSTSGDAPRQETTRFDYSPAPIPSGNSQSFPNHHQGRHREVNPAVMDRAGAARFLGIGLSTLAELTATGDVPSLKVGRRRLYRVADLDSWLAGRVTGGTGPEAA